MSLSVWGSPGIVCLGGCGQRWREELEGLTAEFWAVEDKPRGIADIHVGGGEARTTPTAPRHATVHVHLRCWLR